MKLRSVLLATFLVYVGLRTPIAGASRQLMSNQGDLQSLIDSLISGVDTKGASATVSQEVTNQMLEVFRSNVAPSAPSTGTKAAATPLKSVKAFKWLTSVRAGSLGWPQGGPNLVIRPTRPQYKEPTYGVSQTSKYSSPTNTLKVERTSNGWDEVVLPAVQAAPNPPLERINMEGTNYLLMNALIGSTCEATFTIDKTLLITSQGENGIHFNCLKANKVAYVMQGSSHAVKGSNINIDTMDVYTSQGKNMLFVMPGSSVTVKTVNLALAQGELYVELGSKSTNVVWNNGIQGELWIKLANGTSISKCPKYKAGVNSNGQWLYGGDGIGNSRYCCGRTVDFSKKSCPWGSVRAGKWT